MHELSLAVNIVDIAEENAKKAGVKKFDGITLEIGSLSGVVVEALEMAMSSAFKNSVLEHATIKIEIVKAKARCTQCDHEFEADDIFSPCPECANPFCKIIKGKELKVKSLYAD